eukprot:365428-Chlamydomonas_euryale.AAC.9
MHASAFTNACGARVEPHLRCMTHALHLRRPQCAIQASGRTATSGVLAPLPPRWLPLGMRCAAQALPMAAPRPTRSREAAPASTRARRRPPPPPQLLVTPPPQLLRRRARPLGLTGLVFGAWALGAAARIAFAAMGNVERRRVQTQATAAPRPTVRPAARGMGTHCQRRLHSSHSVDVWGARDTTILRASPRRSPRGAARELRVNRPWEYDSCADCAARQRHLRVGRHRRDRLRHTPLRALTLFACPAPRRILNGTAASALMLSMQRPLVAAALVAAFAACRCVRAAGQKCFSCMQAMAHVHVLSGCAAVQHVACACRALA